MGVKLEVFSEKAPMCLFEEICSLCRDAFTEKEATNKRNVVMMNLCIMTIFSISCSSFDTKVCHIRKFGKKNKRKKKAANKKSC